MRNCRLTSARERGAGVHTSAYLQRARRGENEELSSQFIAGRNIKCFWIDFCNMSGMTEGWNPCWYERGQVWIKTTVSWA